MLGRPPLMSASYIAESFAFMPASASLTHVRIGRSGWFAGTNSSRRTVVNRFSL
jgi:hypothetical protein